MNWNVECWSDWLVTSIKMFYAATKKSERRTAFLPILINPEIDGPKEIYFILEAILDDASKVRLNEGLTDAIVSSSVEWPGKIFAYLFRMISYTDAKVPVSKLPRILNEVFYYGDDEAISDLSNALAQLSLFRLSSQEIDRFIPEAEPFFKSEPASACMIAAKYACDEPAQYSQILKQLYPEIFNRRSSDDHWVFAIDKLVEHAGYIAAIEATISSLEDGANKVAEALSENRITLAWQFWGSDFSAKYAFDRFEGKRIYIPNSTIALYKSKIELIKGSDLEKQMDTDCFKTYNDLDVSPDTSDYFGHSGNQEVTIQ